MSTYLERLRTEKMKKGSCELCGEYASPLERHHVSYKPEKTIFICHNCHWKCHFNKWLLTNRQKEKIENIRQG